MFDHVSLGVTDLARSLLFYDAVMGALGHRRYFGSENEGFMAYGDPADFFVICLPLDETRSASAGNGTHLCFKASSRKHVDDFYQAALDQGGSCDGPPGVRPEYDANHYAAFVRDPDGHKIEAVARAP